MSVTTISVTMLYPRESQILTLASYGKTNRAIAIELGIAHMTVKNHFVRVARKLGTGDRTEMVVVALRGRLIDQVPYSDAPRLWSNS